MKIRKGDFEIEFTTDEASSAIESFAEFLVDTRQMFQDLSDDDKNLILRCLVHSDKVVKDIRDFGKRYDPDKKADVSETTSVSDGDRFESIKSDIFNIKKALSDLLTRSRLSSKVVTKMETSKVAVGKELKYSVIRIPIVQDISVTITIESDQITVAREIVEDLLYKYFVPSTKKEKLTKYICEDSVIDSYEGDDDQFAEEEETFSISGYLFGILDKSSIVEFPWSLKVGIDSVKVKEGTLRELEKLVSLFMESYSYKKKE